MAEDLGRAVLDLDTNDRRFSKGIKDAERDARKLDRRFDDTSRSARRLGRTMQRTFSAIGAAVSIAAVVQLTRGIARAGVEMQRFERGLKVATGSTEAADREMAFLRDTADRLGLSLRETAGAYVSLAAAAKGTALQGQATRDIFTAISEAATVLGLSAAQTGGALTAIEQIISKGRVSAEELRQQLGERLPGAFQIAARSIGVTTAELDKMLAAGQLTAEELLPNLARELHETFGPEVADAADDAQAAFNRFNTAIFELQNAIATSGILDSLASLADLGTAIAEGFRITFNPTDQERLQQIRRNIEQLLALGANDDSPVIRNLQEQMFAILRRNSDRLAARPDAAGAAEPDRFPITDIPGPAPRPSPVTVRVGGTGGPETLMPEQVQAIGRELSLLQEQALAAQGRTAEAIRVAADRQIEAWRRVAEETPALAGQAAEAIQLINARTAADIANVAEEAITAWEIFGATVRATVEDNLTQALTAVQSFGDAARSILLEIAEAFIRLRIVNPVVGFLGAVLPGFAEGGRPPVGRPSIVGERGPELFVPDSAGTVIPNNALGGMGGISQEFNFPIAFPPQLEAFVRNVAGPAGRDAALQVSNAQRGRF